MRDVTNKKSGSFTQHFTYKKSVLALLVGSFLSASPLMVTAAESDKAEDATESRVVITGSRLKRVDMEGAAPVTTITSLDLQKSGFATVGDVLRNSNLNSFGSWGGGSNNSWGSQATVRLKGASVEHTLVLLDGKRMAKSPVLNGGAANINTIPTAAIDRIEILTDGASAVYGTDAIAGVVNVILKKDFEGVEFSARMDSPSQDGGDSSSYSFTGGLDSDKGNLVFTFEHYEKDVVMNADRWYTKPFIKNGGDPKDFQSWANLSPTGRVLVQGAAGGWLWEDPLVGEDCSVYGKDFKGVLTDSDYPGETMCAFDYTPGAATSVDQTRDNTLVQYNYDVTDNIELNARAYWAKNKTKDISAPVPASINIPDGLPAYTTAAGVQLVELIADPAAKMNYRFDTAGQRIAEHHDTVSDFLIGLKGTEDSFEWDWSASFSSYTNFTWGTGYLLNGAQNELVGSWNATENRFEGWDPRDPASPLPPGASANYDKRKKASNFETAGGVSFEVFDMMGGAAGMYVGASYRDESFDSKVDSLAEAGKIKGGSGGSGGSGERDVSAVFFELAMPVLDSLEVNLAARYDDYSDFGSTFNPQLSVRYNPTDSLLLRTSFGTGFRAPTLSDLYRGTSEGYLKTVNYVRCEAQGQPIEGCKTKETVPVRTSGNIDLEAEESDSFNIGASWEATDYLNVTLDYWTLDTEGLIEDIHRDELMKTQAYLNQAGAGGNVSTIYPHSEISMLGNGRIEYLVAPVINVGLAEREGIDFKASGSVDTEVGKFSYGLGMTKFLKYKYTNMDGGKAVLTEDEAGTEDLPSTRMNVTFDYSLDDHTFSYYGSLIGSQISDEADDNDSSIFYSIDSVMYHNLTYTYSTPWNSRVTLGVVNVTDEDPKFRQDGTFEGDLYSIDGRTYYLQYVQSL